ncbi:hypothetical protein VU10_05345, partial [Desulfobulbus sp. US1]|nr:hypothetical protein [Desulfobulbus sp. US1]
SNATNKFTLLLSPCLCIAVFFRSSFVDFLLTAERKIIINCAYAHNAVWLAECLASAVVVTFRKLYKI